MRGVSQGSACANIYKAPALWQRASSGGLQAAPEFHSGELGGWSCSTISRSRCVHSAAAAVFNCRRQREEQLGRSWLRGLASQPILSVGGEAILQVSGAGACSNCVRGGHSKWATQLLIANSWSQVRSSRSEGVAGR